MKCSLSHKFFFAVVMLLLLVTRVFAGGDLIVDGNVGVGTTTPTQKLSVAGTIETTQGGVKFPDGSLQTSAATAFVPVRQTVLAGATDTNGRASFITVGTGLSPKILGTVTPVQIAFAAGFGSKGAIDYVGSIVSDTSLAVPANQTSYLYAERNTDTGAIVLGFSPLAPIYQYAAPVNISGQHWFSLADYQMRVGNGSIWTIVQRVFLGEATAGASSISGVVSYAYRGVYISDPQTMSAAGSLVLNHNIGCKPQKAPEMRLKCNVSEQGYSVGDEVWHPLSNSIANAVRGVGAIVSNAKLSLKFNSSGYFNVPQFSTGGEGYIYMPNWTAIFVVDRGWK